MMEKNGEPMREMSAPAPQEAVDRGFFWIFDLIVSGILLTLVGAFYSIKEAIQNLFKNPKSVKGKVVVITGSGRGLGRGIALEMSKRGAHIACADINTKNNEETVKLIRAEGGKAEAFTVNIAKSQQVDQLSKDVEKKLGPADIIINNAALVMPVPIDDITYDDIRAYYEINNMGAAFMIKAFLPSMRKRNSGHITSVSSVAAVSTLPWITLYSSTKAGLSKFMDTLMLELNLTPNNQIKVTTVHPFFINTSADYFKWFKSPTPVLNEETVVNAVVDAVLFEKRSVMVPSFLSFLHLFNGILPFPFWLSHIQTLGRGIQIPSKKERDELPYGRIVTQTAADSK